MTSPQTRQQLFDTMVIKPEVNNVVNRKANQLISNKDRYNTIAHRFSNAGLKWWLVAVIHELECTQNFNKYLGNGQDLNKVTTIVPKGRGPFKTFDDGAVDALKLQGADHITDWSMGNILYFLEGYNGYGYSLYHNMNSPYLWAGSNHYKAGKYTNDGHFDPNAVSQQIGVALLLKTIMKL